jgi:hypothetical protein
MAERLITRCPVCDDTNMVQDYAHVNYFGKGVDLRDGSHCAHCGVCFRFNATVNERIKPDVRNIVPDDKL